MQRKNLDITKPTLVLSICSAASRTHKTSVKSEICWTSPPSFQNKDKVLWLWENLFKSNIYKVSSLLVIEENSYFVF